MWVLGELRELFKDSVLGELPITLTQFCDRHLTNFLSLSKAILFFSINSLRNYVKNSHQQGPLRCLERVQ